MKKQLPFFAVLMGLAMVQLSTGAYAANDPAHDPIITERFERQQMRIDEGIKNGSLTKEEAAAVQDNLNRIKAEETQLKTAGQLTEKAKESLMHKLDQNSKMIDSEKKNTIMRID